MGEIIFLFCDKREMAIHNVTGVIPVTFGERLKELREEKNITQKALAATLGVSPRMVSFYESGAHFLSDEMQLCRLAEYFGVSTDYLLGRSSLRPVGQIERISVMFEQLPEAGKRSALDYMGFLTSKYKNRPK